MLKIINILNQTQLFKKFIDDIIWLSYGNKLTKKIEQALTNTCMEYELKLTFRKVSTNETVESLELLDVLHMIDNSNKFGFFTNSFIKETATKRLFLNGNSYHPLCIFKSIVFGESIRLHRLCVIQFLSDVFPLAEMAGFTPFLLQFLALCPSTYLVSEHPPSNQLSLSPLPLASSRSSSVVLTFSCQSLQDLEQPSKHYRHPSSAHVHTI